MNIPDVISHRSDIDRARFLTNHRHLMVPLLFSDAARRHLDSLLLQARWNWESARLAAAARISWAEARQRSPA